MEALEGGGVGFAGVAEGFHWGSEGDGLGGGEEGGYAEHPEEEGCRAGAAGDAQQGGGNQGQGGEDKLIFLEGVEQDGDRLDAQGVVIDEQAGYEEEGGAQAAEPKGPGEADQRGCD